MKKGELTKQNILAQAVQIYSVRGYGGMSFDEVMRVTGLTKGGIYNHFDSKDQLAFEVFDYAVEQMRDRFRQQLDGKRTMRTRLFAVIEMFQSLLEDPLFSGGCVLLTTAVEADDMHPALRQKAQQAFDDWHGVIVRTVKRGLELGDVRAGTDPDSVASLIVASLEGAIVLSKTYGDLRHMQRVVAHLQSYVESLLQEKALE